MHLRDIAVVAGLLNDGHFRVTAVVRPTSKYSPPTSSENINTITTDYEDASSLLNALRNQDAVVCCVPGSATKFAPQKLLIDAAIEAGVKLFFASEFVSNILSPHYAIFPKQFVGDKVKVRKYLKERASAGEMAYTALNGGPFFDMWLMGGPAGFDIPTRKAKIYSSGNNISCWTPLPVLHPRSSPCCATLTYPESRHLRLGRSGPDANRHLGRAGSETGDKFEVEHVDVKQIKENALAELEKEEYKQATRGLTINSRFNAEDSVATFGIRWKMSLSALGR
ncbi:MAG: hypothetical protein M1830_008117 [Pleopsidium flavum]|nr:MAG: hypothetical protein M1830_008117 [Pleopsidium flavum]